jgi:hypothetical protein
LIVHVNDARVPVDNNAVENAMRPIALGRKNWLFIGSQQAGERAATLMSLIESAKLNGHDAWAYLKDVLTKLPTWPNSRLAELLPHRWVTSSSTGSLSQSLDGLAACLRSRPASPRCAGRRFGMTVVMRQVKDANRAGLEFGGATRTGIRGRSAHQLVTKENGTSHGLLGEAVTRSAASRVMRW